MNGQARLDAVGRRQRTCTDAPAAMLRTIMLRTRVELPRTSHRGVSVGVRGSTLELLARAWDGDGSVKALVFGRVGIWCGRRVGIWRRRDLGRRGR